LAVVETSAGLEVSALKLIKKASKSAAALTIVVSPNSLSPAPSTSSVMKTPDLQSPGPSAPLVEPEEPQNTKKRTLITLNQQLKILE
jgi:type VI protein secretion system component VasA